MCSLQEKCPGAAMSIQCPATMCPLIAPNGSPWTGDKGAVCPEKYGFDRGTSCPHWDMCKDSGGLSGVDEALAGHTLVIGPNKPKRQNIGPSKSYDCPKAEFCSWQKQSPTNLCGPRQALKEGIDPRVCLF